MQRELDDPGRRARRAPLPRPLALALAAARLGTMADAAAVGMAGRLSCGSNGIVAGHPRAIGGTRSCGTGTSSGSTCRSGGRSCRSSARSASRPAGTGACPARKSASGWGISSGGCRNVPCRRWRDSRHGPAVFARSILRRVQLPTTKRSLRRSSYCWRWGSERRRSPCGPPDGRTGRSARYWPVCGSGWASSITGASSAVDQSGGDRVRGAVHRRGGATRMVRGAPAPDHVPGITGVARGSRPGPGRVCLRRLSGARVGARPSLSGHPDVRSAVPDDYRHARPPGMDGRAAAGGGHGDSVVVGVDRIGGGVPARGARGPGIAGGPGRFAVGLVRSAADRVLETSHRLSEPFARPGLRLSR